MIRNYEREGGTHMAALLTSIPDRLGHPGTNRSLLASGMDVIADMLSAARAGGATTVRLRAAAPWGVRRDHVPSVACHLVTQGTCWLRTPGAEPLRLGTGDFALLPDGAGHTLSSDRQGSRVLDDDVIGDRPRGAGPEIDIGGIGPETRWLCAGYRSTGALPAPLLALLPPVLHVPRESAVRGDLTDTLRMLALEATADRPGSQIIVDRLIDILVVHALREWLLSGLAATWPAALHDLAVATAVTALHHELHRPWTLDELAARSGLSRATLTRRFTLLIGEPPLSYLRHKRMELAARRLRESDETLTAIADRVGYASEFAFSRAFSRTFGVAPGRYRTANRPDRHHLGDSTPVGTSPDADGRTGPRTRMP
jgi:AraC-like DNA-binding protein